MALALSAHDEEQYVWEMLEAGAMGYALKNERRSTIVSAIRAVARGERWFSRDIQACVAAWAPGNARTVAGLTEREVEIVRLVARAYTNREIAEDLGLAEVTVEYHMGHILGKLGMRRRVEVALWATERHLSV